MAITPFSTTPSRNMTEDEFVAAANTRIAEEDRFVTEANALAADVTSKQTAAATSATASADSATASAASATASANSATASANSATESEGFKDSAEVAAAAAQAAAGLPSLVGNGLNVLGVNAAEDGVEWVPGLSGSSTSGATQAVNLSGNVVHQSTADAATVTYTFSSSSPVSKTDLIITPTVITPYYIQNMLYRGNTATITSQTTAGIFIRFNSDGSKLFVLSNEVDAETVWEYSLSTPYDLSTLSYTQKLDVYLEVAETVEGFDMSLDGTKLYVLERGVSAEIHEWTLSTGFDLSTATYTRGHRVSELDDISLYGCHISGDGAKFYIWTLSNNGDVYQYSLSTPYNVSTESLDAVYDIVDGFDNVRDITFTDSGSKVWVLAAGEISQRNLSTPYDLSTASAVQATGTRPEGTSALAFEFTSDGERLFTVSGDDLYEVLCTQLSTLVFPPSVEIPTSGVPVVYEEKTALSIVTSDGGTSYQVTNVQGAIK